MAKNDGLLIQCANCDKELNIDEIHYAYGYVLCIGCLYDLGEGQRQENYMEWIKEKGSPREDN